MGKKRTSAKREFYFEGMPKVRLKSRTGVRGYDAAACFRDPGQVFEALIDALKSGDADAFKEILSAYLEVTNKDAFVRASGISRRTLFRMLSPEGNPTLDNITKVVSALKKAA
jgi:probable addiction module antidote protein